MALPPGFHAPGFTLESTHGTVSLQDLRGRNVVLTFYPGDWTPVCGGQLDIYNELREVFHELNAVVLGVSVDSAASHRAWSDERGLDIPLLADFEPKGDVARRYDVFNETTGTAERAIFVIDGNGVIRWSYVSPYQENPGANGIIATLEGIEGKERTCSRFPHLTEQVSEQDHARGSGVTIVEYGDLECPDCRRAHEVLNTLDIPHRLVFRHFPLRSIHQHAQLAAESTEAARGKFWELHDRIYVNQERLGEDFLLEAAQELGLDVPKFKEDLAVHAYADRVQRDFISGCKSGVIGTPTFFIDGERYEGSVDKKELEEALSRRLDASGVRERAAA